MRPTATLLAILVSGLVSAAMAQDDGFVALAGGIHYPNGEVRNLTDTKYGMHLNLGLGAYGQAMVGFPTFEFDWGHITGKGNRLDTVNVCYCERLTMSEGVYIGGGAGTAWNRFVRGHESGGDDSPETTFRFCLRGMVGMTIFRQFYVEGSAFYNGKVGGVDANALAVLLGVRF